MKLFHTTVPSSAQFIQKEGFRDSEGYYGTSKKLKGVFFSDTVSNVNDFGWEPGTEEPNCVFVVEIPEGKITAYELHQKHGGREWCILSKIVNEYFTDKTAYNIDDPILYK